MDYLPEELALAILTVPRNPQYIHQTLASLFAADPLVHRLDAIWLMVGCDDKSYLRRYLHHEKLKIVPLSSEESARIKEWSRHRRFNHNYHRCLSLPLLGKRGILVCEDDVVFRDKFLARLLDTIHEMEVERRLAQYALALFAAYDFEDDRSFYRGRYYCSYGYPFYGTPAMYYPTPTCSQIRAYLERYGVSQVKAPGDMLIKEFYGDRMYACSRALAQHVGEVSTGLGGGGGTVTFDRPYRPLSPDDWGAKK